MWGKTFFKDTTSNQNMSDCLCCSKLLVPKKAKDIVAMSYTLYIYTSYLEPVKTGPLKQVPLMIQNHHESSKRYVYI